MESVDRIFECLKKSELSQKDLADRLGIKKSVISQWKGGTNKSYNKYLPQIAEALGTSTEYLLTGKKTATLAQHQETTTVKDGGLLEEFGRIFDSLTPENQNAVIAEMLRRFRNQ